MVIGHRNPDTDSICSAIAYSNLKNKTVGPWHEACRAGEINQETAFVLKRFGAKPPRRCLNVSAQVQDIDIRPVPGILGNTTMRRAWETMRDTQANSQPVVDEKGVLQGLITLGDLAVANMDSLDTHALSNARTPIKNVVEVLGGTVLAGDDSGYFESGKIVIGCFQPGRAGEHHGSRRHRAGGQPLRDSAVRHRDGCRLCGGVHGVRRGQDHHQAGQRARLPAHQQPLRHLRRFLPDQAECAREHPHDPPQQAAYLPAQHPRGRGQEGDE